jgi:hypothetical protein
VDYWAGTAFGDYLRYLYRGNDAPVDGWDTALIFLETASTDIGAAAIAGLTLPLLPEELAISLGGVGIASAVSYAYSSVSNWSSLSTAEKATFFGHVTAFAATALVSFKVMGKSSGVGVPGEPAPGSIPAFGPNTLSAAEAPRYIQGYGWTDRRYWNLVNRLRAGESVVASSLRMAAELRRDAFPDLVRSRYRGLLSKAPDLSGTYDWHDPRVMIHPGAHQTPHLQIKTIVGTILRIEVPE